MKIDYAIVGKKRMRYFKGEVCFRALPDLPILHRRSYKYIRWRPPALYRVAGTSGAEVLDAYLGKVSEVYPEIPSSAKYLEKLGITINVQEHTYFYVLACMSWARRWYEERDRLPPSLNTMVREWGMDLEASMAWTSMRPLISYYNFIGHFVGRYHRDFAFSYRDAQSVEKEILSRHGPCCGPDCGRISMHQASAESIIRGKTLTCKDGDASVWHIYNTSTSDGDQKRMIRDAMKRGVGYRTIYTPSEE